MSDQVRCHFSQVGCEWLNPRNPYRGGVLLRETEGSRYVRWDGTKTPHRYAKRFIETSEDIDMRGLLTPRQRDEPSNEEAQNAGA